ncbi:hypothetical protein C900_00565 [Fulvivirga imtechensis AK7]|uniref:Uncharacterized protein n=1 Tax=Fulvivirga imtechensis AK7 TaxID=1237149 RepID=L8JHH2_9BACT|nr:hypothetical protein C900_00565 [Fulvivirga imtechensis AK7]
MGIVISIVRSAVAVKVVVVIIVHRQHFQSRGREHGVAVAVICSVHRFRLVVGGGLVVQVIKQRLYSCPGSLCGIGIDTVINRALLYVIFGKIPLVAGPQVAILGKHRPVKRIVNNIFHSLAGHFLFYQPAFGIVGVLKDQLCYACAVGIEGRTCAQYFHCLWGQGILQLALVVIDMVSLQVAGVVLYFL